MQVDFHDPLIGELLIDGEPMDSIDPDPRRDASGFGPEDYELAIVLGPVPGLQALPAGAGLHRPAAVAHQAYLMNSISE